GQGEVTGLSVGVLQHEIRHKDYKESKDHNSIAEKIKEGDYKGFKNFIKTHNDPAYMMDEVLLADVVLERITQRDEIEELLDTMPEDVEQMIEMSNGDEASARDYVQNWHNIFTVTIEKSDQELSVDNEEDFMEIAGEYNFIGVSEETFREIYYASPELQQYQKETARELRAELIELFPEYIAELKSEKDQELDQEQELEGMSGEYQVELGDEYQVPDEGEDINAERQRDLEPLHREGPRRMM
ncbi:MAG: hypothetical protein ABH846_01145, partial [Patescibacteria group bacterium]